MTGGDDSSSTGPGDDPPGSVSSGRAMGVRRLGNALKKARGTMSQKAAAAAWGIPIATLGAIEQGKVRNYQPPTVAPLDKVLGRSAWDMLQEPEEAPAERAELDALRAELRAEFAPQIAVLVVEVQRLTEALAARPARTGGVASLVEEMDAEEMAAVAAFVHLILARRRNAG